MACKIATKPILNHIILALFESCNRFMLNEKTPEQHDPLDLIIDRCNELSLGPDPVKLIKEALLCVKLLIGFGHPLKERHIDRFVSPYSLQAKISHSLYHDITS